MEEEPANEDQVQVVELISKVHRGRWWIFWLAPPAAHGLLVLRPVRRNVSKLGNSAGCISFITARQQRSAKRQSKVILAVGAARGRWRMGVRTEREREEREMERQGDVAEVMGKPSSETVIWVICQAAFSRPDLMFSQLSPRPPSQPFTSCLLIV